MSIGRYWIGPAECHSNLPARSAVAASCAFWICPLCDDERNGMGHVNARQRSLPLEEIWLESTHLRHSGMRHVRQYMLSQDLTLCLLICLLMFVFLCLSLKLTVNEVRSFCQLILRDWYQRFGWLQEWLTLKPRIIRGISRQVEIVSAFQKTKLFT